MRGFYREIPGHVHPGHVLADDPRNDRILACEDLSLDQPDHRGEQEFLHSFRQNVPD